jgi:glutathione S-transferase
MITLHYVPRTRAMRARWILEELGVPYELVRLDPAKQETHAPEHLARHPLGHVPVLEDGEVRIFESAAICYWLAERYGEGRLLPPPATPARALAYQWLAFALSELEAPLGVVGAEHRRPESERDGKREAEAKEKFRAAAAAVEQVLERQPYLLGAEFSVADVLVSAVLGYGKFLGALESPTLAAWIAKTRDRPAYRKAIADQRSSLRRHVDARGKTCAST